MTESSEKESNPPTGGRRGARRAGVQAVYQWLVAGTDIGDLLRQFREEHRLLACDVDYFDAVVRGVVADRYGLEAAFDNHLDRAPSQLDPVEHAILLQGTFELRDRIDVPAGAVINEAVELTKHFGAEGGHRYINGVLDRVARDLRRSETSHSG